MRFFFVEMLPITHKHPAWHYTFGLVVPLIAVFLPWLLWDRIRIKAPKPIKAVVMGGIVALVTWVLMRYVFHEKRPLQNAVLAGLLAAEVMTFSGGAFPNMANITLWLFFYYNSILMHAGEH